MLFNSCMFSCSAVCVVVLDFELVFGCGLVGREEMLTGRSKVLTVKETVPEIRHGSIETSTYSGKRRKHTLIYAFVLLKQNNCYYSNLSVLFDLPLPNITHLLILNFHTLSKAV